MLIKKLVMFGLMSAVLAACSTGRHVPKSEPPPVDIIDRSEPELNESVVTPPQQAPVSRPRRQSDPIVVAGLQKDARQYSKKGDSARAAAILERALRIQPRNAQLWHDLAQVRYTQERYDQAESLALRSNRYVSSASPLQKENWALIARAREQLGNSQGAAEARRLAQ